MIEISRNMIKTKPFNKVILHFGSEKTGTTSIQMVCDKNRILLENFGIYYPFGNWHCELASCFSMYPENEITNIVFGHQDSKWIKLRDNNYISNLRAELSHKSGEFLLLSCESFNFLDEKAMSDLKMFVLEFADIAEVVYYVRSPISYAISTKSQHVKMGISSFAPVAEYAVRLERMVAVFGKENMHVHLFSRHSLVKSDVVIDFLSLLNVPMHVIKDITNDIPIENTSLSLEGLLVGEKIRELVSDENLSSIDFMKRYEHKINKIKGQKIRLSESEIKSITINSKHDSDYLQREFDISFNENMGEYSKLEHCNSEMVNSIAELIVALASEEEHTQNNRIVTTPEFKVINLNLNFDYDVTHGQMLCFEIEFVLDREIVELEAGVHIWDMQKWWAFGTNSTLQNQVINDVEPGIYRINHYVVADLPEGVYTVGFAFAEKLSNGSSNELLWYDKLCEFRVSHPTDRIGVGYANLSATVALTKMDSFEKNIIYDASGCIVPLEIPSELGVSDTMYVKVEIHNDTDIAWCGDPFRAINLSYHFLDNINNPIIYDGVRTPIPESGIAPHGSVLVSMEVTAPEQAGQYHLILTMVQEDVGWFENIGFQAFITDIKVK